jgi:hypothetical protein
VERFDVATCGRFGVLAAEKPANSDPVWVTPRPGCGSALACGEDGPPSTSTIPQRGCSIIGWSFPTPAHYFWAGVSFEFLSIAKSGSV